MARISAVRAVDLEEGLSVQAAAVCYRMSRLHVEFLLVKTSSGKWTFPKGRLNPGMSASESAAQEAWEEAGATGRIENRHFNSYVDIKRGLRHDAGTREVRILTYLLRVESTVTPHEIGRHPNWFPADAAKKQLAEGRPSRHARQIASVIDSAVKRLSARKTSHRPQVIGHRKAAISN
jgi:8-oxo-dGTP pyrophosphatase MutT (NUDIX family)